MRQCMTDVHDDCVVPLTASKDADRLLSNICFCNLAWAGSKIKSSHIGDYIANAKASTTLNGSISSCRAFVSFRYMGDTLFSSRSPVMRLYDPDITNTISCLPTDSVCGHMQKCPAQSVRRRLAAGASGSGSASGSSTDGIASCAFVPLGPATEFCAQVAQM